MSATADAAHEAALLLRARAGDPAAVEDLYAAHVGPARRLATALAGPSAAEDLVADAFARVISQIRGGRGPATNFRAYLFTTIRNRYFDARRLARRENPVSDQPWILEDNQDPVRPPEEDLTPAFGEDDAIAAFNTLPETWQKVLWHLEVEGRAVPEVATLLRTTPAAVSSLAYRAREGLKVAYLNRRLGNRPKDRHCKWVQDRLGQYVRDSVSQRAVAKIEAHLEGCTSCSTALAQLEQTNRRLAGILLPAVLVGGVTHLAAGGGFTDGGSGQGTSLAARTALQGRRVAKFFAAPVGVTMAAATVALVSVAAVAWWPGGAEPAPASSRPTIDVPSPPQSADLPPISPPQRERPADKAADRPAVPPAAAAAPVRTPQPPPAPTPPAAPLPVGAVKGVVERSGLAATPAPDPGANPGLKPPPAPKPIVVTTEAPVATPITACGTYGSLVLPTTEGVKYTQTGDGKEGLWTVEASAEPGYELARGSATRWDGDLGTFDECPSLPNIVSVTSTNSSVTTQVQSDGSTPTTLVLQLVFDTTVFVTEDHGTGWNCWAESSAGREQLNGTAEYQLIPGVDWVTCEFTGVDPGQIQVVGDAMGNGTAILSSDGTERDRHGF